MSYTVEQRAGCTLVSGNMPLSHLIALTRAGEQEAKDAVLSTDLANLADVQFAWGPPDAVDALIRELRDQRIRQAERHPIPGLSPQAQAWLAAGEKGISSCVLFRRLSGVTPKQISDTETGHPHDPDDLRRCLLLLDAVPEFQARLPEMANVSPYWAALVPHWDRLTALFESECPRANWENPPPGAKAPQTYRAMREILDRVAG
jgi:hypothetical protein